MGFTLKKAFDEGKTAIAGSPKEECSICCCMHDHKEGCLFLEYVKELNDDWDEACRQLHQGHCDCYVAI